MKVFPAFGPECSELIRRLSVGRSFVHVEAADEPRIAGGAWAAVSNNSVAVFAVLAVDKMP